MSIKTAEGKTVVLEKLLAEAHAEADGLRKDIERLENIVRSTRLIMGHEIKKPVTAISGYLDLVCDDLETVGELTTLSFAQKARDECAFLEKLNTFYLDLLRTDKKHEYSESPKVNVPGLVSKAVGHLRQELNARHRVSINMPRDIGLIDFDPNAFELIMLNLIENALVYSRKDTLVTVVVDRVSEKRGMASGEILRIRVEDEGFGIPEEYLKKIFCPFVRLREDIASGTGLGLTLVRSLVELNGGDVFIRSVLGKGTTVHLTIPVKNGAESVPPGLL